MAEAVLALIAAMLGGLLVLLANVVVRRSEERHRWSEQVQKTTADLVGTYGAARSALIGARDRGDGLPSEERLEYVERNRLYSYFACTPGCEPLIPPLERLTSAIVALRDAFDADDETWERSNEDAKAALVAVQAAVRSHVDGQKSLFAWRPRPLVDEAKSRSVNRLE